MSCTRPKLRRNLQPHYIYICPSHHKELKNLESEEVPGEVGVVSGRGVPWREWELLGELGDSLKRWELLESHVVTGDVHSP